MQQAVKYFKLADDQGNSNSLAASNSGECYKYGHGVDEDKHLAVKYISMAANMGGGANAQFIFG